MTMRRMAHAVVAASDCNGGSRPSVRANVNESTGVVYEDRMRLPWSMRLANRAGTFLRAAGVPLGSLDDAALLAAARRRTRLDDFGDPFFREGLARLLHAFEHEAALTPVGRALARRQVLDLLENRLRMTAEWTRHPAILAAPVPAPIFVLGLPRTGTSILHELLAQDPENRVPLTWEVMWPWPPPERATYEQDPRIARAERHFAGIDRMLPEFKRMHPLGARLPQECVALMAHDFASLLFPTTHRVPSYQAWLDRLDQRPVYAAHRRQLQYLQWKAPAARWVLKSPGHLWTLAALLAEYPDARIVQTHRDPLRVIASLASLIVYLRGMASDRVDAREIGAEWTERLAAGLAHTMDVRAQGLLPAARVFDVEFRAFVGNEIATIRRLYEHFGLVLSAEADARMRRFLAVNPKDKHGAHRYGLADAGLDPTTERRRYARYQEQHVRVLEPLE
jgi:hypothetical protein